MRAAQHQVTKPTDFLDDHGPYDDPFNDIHRTTKLMDALKEIMERQGAESPRACEAVRRVIEGLSRA